VTQDDDYLSGVHNPYDGWDWPTLTGFSTLRKWNGGWHAVWESASTSSPGYFLVTSGAYDKRRAYWGSGGRVWCIDLFSGVHNPRRNPTATFDSGPKQHHTPWFDYGSDVQDKVQGHLYLRTADCSATNQIDIYYGVDMDETTWLFVGSITSNGFHTFTFGDGAGVPGKTFRFRFDLRRGSTTTLSPIIELWSAEFLKLLPAQYAFAVEVDLSKSYRGLSPSQLAHQLQVLADPDRTPTLILFAYKDTHDDDPQTHWARISKLDGHEFSGSDLRGQSTYRVSLMVPYSQDSV
jgi:hypothetical protein